MAKQKKQKLKDFINARADSIIAYRKDPRNFIDAELIQRARIKTQINDEKVLFELCQIAHDRGIEKNDYSMFIPEEKKREDWDNLKKTCHELLKSIEMVVAFLSPDSINNEKYGEFVKDCTNAQPLEFFDLYGSLMYYNKILERKVPFEEQTIDNLKELRLIVEHIAKPRTKGNSPDNTKQHYVHRIQDTLSKAGIKASTTPSSSFSKAIKYVFSRPDNSCVKGYVKLRKR